MAKRLGGGLLEFGVNTACEFCISYNVRMGEVCPCARSFHISTPSYETKLVQVYDVQVGNVSVSVCYEQGNDAW
jgi:hypothetical protein